MPVNNTLVQFREENNEHEFHHLLLKNLDGRTSASTLHENGTVGELRGLLNSCWDGDRLPPVHLTINGQQVTKDKQLLSAHGFQGSGCLLVVREVVCMKLKGGMEK